MKIAILSLLIGTLSAIVLGLQTSPPLGAIPEPGKKLLSEVNLPMPDNRKIKMRTFSEVRKHPFENRDITIWRASIEEDYGTWKVERDFIVLDPTELPAKIEELRQKYG